MDAIKTNETTILTCCFGPEESEGVETLSTPVGSQATMCPSLPLWKVETWVKHVKPSARLRLLALVRRGNKPLTLFSIVY